MFQPYSTPSGIRLNDCLFSEPVALAGWTPPQFAGISAVFVRDPNWAPKPFQPLCFSEFGNNAPHSAWLDNYDELLRAAQGRELLVAVCPIPFSTTAQRRAVRDELISAYNPVCQSPTHSRPAVQPSQAQPLREPARTQRRPIGFMPDCKPAG
jgi:hypothetical protein